MILRITFELVLAIATFFVGNFFWQLIKRDKFLRKVIKLQPLLEELIRKNTIDKPNSKIAAYADRNLAGYFLNIGCVVESDRSTTKRLEILFFAIGVVIIAISYIIGLIYCIINTIIFLLLAFSPITQLAQHNALEHILEIAVILYRWSSENQLECDEFINHTSSLQPLYNAIKNVYQK